MLLCNPEMTDYKLSTDRLYELWPYGISLLKALHLKAVLRMILNQTKEMLFLDVALDAFLQAGESTVCSGGSWIRTDGEMGPEYEKIRNAQR